MRTKTKSEPSPASAARAAKAEARRVGGDFPFVVRRRLRELRERAHVTQQNVSTGMRLLGIPWSKTTVVNVERGNRNVSFRELLALAALFEVPALDLLSPYEGEPIDVNGAPLERETIRELLVGGEPDWQAARNLTGGSALAQRRREAEAEASAELARIAGDVAGQFRRMLRHLPAEELPESAEGEPEALAFRTVAGRLFVRREADGAVYALHPDCPGVVRYTVKRGRAVAAHFMDGQLVSEQATSPPAELAALN